MHVANCTFAAIDLCKEKEVMELYKLALNQYCQTEEVTSLPQSVTLRSDIILKTCCKKKQVKVFLCTLMES